MVPMPEELVRWPERTTAVRDAAVRPPQRKAFGESGRVQASKESGKCGRGLRNEPGQDGSPPGSSTDKAGLAREKGAARAGRLRAEKPGTLWQRGRGPTPSGARLWLKPAERKSWQSQYSGRPASTGLRKATQRLRSGLMREAAGRVREEKRAGRTQGAIIGGGKRCGVK